MSANVNPLPGDELEPRRTSGVLLAVAIGLTIVSVIVMVAGFGDFIAERAGTGGSRAWLFLAVAATPAAWWRFTVARSAEREYRSRQAARQAQWVPGGPMQPQQTWSAAVQGGPPTNTPTLGVVRTRRHRTWVAPLVTIPVIIVAAVLLIVALRSVDAPREAIRTVTFTMIVGVILALGVLVLGVVRFFRAPPKPRMTRAPLAPRPARKQGFYDELSSEDAKRRGLTAEEYGVYKGDVGSIVRPINSAGGLLFIALLLTVLNVFILVLIGVGIAQANGLLASNPDDHPLGPVEWFFLGFEMLFTPIAWRYYVVERRAQKLRISRGLPPTLR